MQYRDLDPGVYLQQEIAPERMELVDGPATTILWDGTDYLGEE